MTTHNAAMPEQLVEPLLSTQDAEDLQGFDEGRELDSHSFVFPKVAFIPDHEDEGVGYVPEPPCDRVPPGVPPEDTEHGTTPSGQGATSSFGWTVLQLSKVILGSGMLVLPRAFQLLGIVLATTLLSAVGILTWFTVAGLAYASEVMHKHTYAAVVRGACGRPAKWGLLAAIFVNCLGMCVVFQVIFGDILIGSAPEYSGVLRTLFPSIDPDSWWMDRPVVIAAVTLSLLLPLCLTRDLARLGPLALAGVGAVMLFALSTVALAGAALAQGKQSALPLWPDWDGLAGGAGALGGGGNAVAAALDRGKGGKKAHGHGSASVVLGITAVIPLLLNADICHQSVFPAMQLLVPYTRKSFIWVMGIALGLCNSLYCLIAVCCIMCFGTDLDSNVLNNINVVHVTPLIGAVPAFALALLVRVTYFVSLLGSFVFTLHPLRVCVTEVLLGSNYATKKQAKASALFVPITLALLLMSYAIAVGVPGIWVVLSVVGSSASTFMGFVFPALVIFIMNVKHKWQHWVKRSVAVLVALTGLFLFGNGVVIQVYSSSSGSKAG